MKRPCFGYFFNKYCCSLVSYRPLPNAKPVSGKKAGKNKLVLSSVYSDLQTSNTIYSVGAKAWNSKNERIFLKKQIFFLSFVLVSCFLVLNFARREFYVFPITGNAKVTGCWIFRSCAVRSAKHLAASWRIDRDFCNSRKVFTSEMSKMICCDLAMGGRAEILKVWLSFRVWYAVGAKIVRWRYRQVPVLLHNKFTICSTLKTVMPLSHRFLIQITFPPEFAG